MRFLRTGHRALVGMTSTTIAIAKGADTPVFLERPCKNTPHPGEQLWVRRGFSTSNLQRPFPLLKEYRSEVMSFFIVILYGYMFAL
jgi:hypothetical protein